MKGTIELYLAVHLTYQETALIADFHLSLTLDKPQSLVHYIQSLGLKQKLLAWPSAWLN